MCASPRPLVATALVLLMVAAAVGPGPVAAIAIEPRSDMRAAHEDWRPPFATPQHGQLAISTGVQKLQPGQAPVEQAPVDPPARLSDTGLYETGRPGVVDARNRPFAPQYPLWTDGATKARWIGMPLGAVIDASDATGWRFPVGTRLWKEFSFNGRKVETRLLWRVTASGWIAASYLWNDEQTDAQLVPPDGLPRAAEIAPGRWHGVPSRTDCLACHGRTPTTALGFNLLQLSTDRDPNALHAESLAPGMVTLSTLVGERLIAPADPGWIAAPPRIVTSNPRTRTMLGYLAANCGSCHNANGEIAVSGPSLAFKDVMADGDAVARQLIGHATTWQVPGVAEGQSALVQASDPERSAMLVRMRSRRPSSQMPPLGTVMPDPAAIAEMAFWIATDLVPSHARPTQSDRR
jgi:mono/diheme cytochrome c family protein